MNFYRKRGFPTASLYVSCKIDIGILAPLFYTGTVNEQRSKCLEIREKE